MIIIADSGSTKTHWALIRDNEVTGSYYTEGINPFFRNSGEILEELKEKLLPGISGKVNKVHFYGAGVINRSKGEEISKLIHDLFPYAEIEAESDLLAAARATCGKQKGIVCILGTGSNSCLYNGEKIVEQVSPLGFILGDEGSGAVMGKKLVADYLKKVMPENLREKFGEEYKLTGPEILELVYRKERPNLFLAKFTRFILKNIDTDYCYRFVVNEFEAFVDRNLFNYTEIQLLPVCFVGSVAFYFQEILKGVIDKKGLQCDKIIKDPMEGLVKFHLNKL